MTDIFPVIHLCSPHSYAFPGEHIDDGCRRVRSSQKRQPRTRHQAARQKQINRPFSDGTGNSSAKRARPTWRIRGRRPRTISRRQARSGRITTVLSERRRSSPNRIGRCVGWGLQQRPRYLSCACRIIGGRRHIRLRLQPRRVCHPSRGGADRFARTGQLFERGRARLEEPRGVSRVSRRLRPRLLEWPTTLLRRVSRVVQRWRNRIKAIGRMTPQKTAGRTSGYRRL